MARAKAVTYFGQVMNQVLEQGITVINEKRARIMMEVGLDCLIRLGHNQINDSLDREPGMPQTHLYWCPIVAHLGEVKKHLEAAH